MCLNEKQLHTELEATNTFRLIESFQCNFVWVTGLEIDNDLSKSQGGYVRTLPAKMEKKRK